MNVTGVLAVLKYNNMQYVTVQNNKGVLSLHDTTVCTRILCVCSGVGVEFGEETGKL